MIESLLSHYPSIFRKATLPNEVLQESKKRVLDSLGCFFGAYKEKPSQLLRKTFSNASANGATLWGMNQKVDWDLAAWINGAGVRALDYNDTYLSKEPCHPSDLISTLWTACELSGSKNQGITLLKAMVLSYEVVCRLCDANSLRTRGWDHVTYLPIASAVGCSYILGLSKKETQHAISLSMIGNNAMRQTRVGTISDWKAACAAYAAKTGLWAARLAKNGFTGPSDIFSGRNGFFKQVSGPFKLSPKALRAPWKMMDTHTKFFPAEHHAQSAIEAAVALRSELIGADDIQRITIEAFDVAVSIIGSEKEKWSPRTRETADHSLPYMVAIALLEGDVKLEQYEKKRFLDSDVRALMKKVFVKDNSRYTKMYPKSMATRIVIKLKNGKTLSNEVIRPKGYAGRPMSFEDVQEKFERLSHTLLSTTQRKTIIQTVNNLERVQNLQVLTQLMKVTSEK